MTTKRQQFSRWIAILGVGALALTACADPVSGRAVADPGVVSTDSQSDPSTVNKPDPTPSTTSGPSSSESSSSSSSASSTSSSSSESEDPQEPTDDPPEPTDGEDEGSSPAPTGDETPPGTTLAITDSATMPLEYAGENGIFTFSDIKAVQGTAEDWKKLGAEEETAGLSPWYVSFTVTQVGGDLKFEYSDFGFEIDGVTDQGRELEIAIVSGGEVGCESGYYKPGYALGDSYTTCAVWQTDDRAKLVQLEFRGDYDGPYYESPVVWTVS